MSDSDSDNSSDESSILIENILATAAEKFSPGRIKTSRSSNKGPNFLPDNAVAISELDQSSMSALDLRRQANRLIQRRRRANETAEQRARRLAAEAQARRVSRANETDEQRRERLRKNAEAIRLARARESPEQSESRRQKMAMSRRLLRQRETEEQRQERLRKSAEARRNQRANETEEQRVARRAREALARKIARAKETEEEKSERRRRASLTRRRAFGTDSEIEKDDGQQGYSTYSDGDQDSTSNDRICDENGNPIVTDGDYQYGERLPLNADIEESDLVASSHTFVVQSTGETIDSEAVRQQIFRKKYRPHMKSGPMELAIASNVVESAVKSGSDEYGTSDSEEEKTNGSNILNSVIIENNHALAVIDVHGTSEESETQEPYAANQSSHESIDILGKRKRGVGRQKKAMMILSTQ